MLDVSDVARSEAGIPGQDRYRLVLDGMDHGFCVVEVLFEGDVAVDYRFLEVNAVFEREPGLIGEVGRTMRSIAPEYEAVWFETYGRVAKTGVPERFNYIAPTLDRCYIVHATRIDRPEQRRVAVVFTDVTGVERSRVALAANKAELAALVVAQSESLEQAVRSKAQQDLISREMGHRLKNILALVQAIVIQTLRSDESVATMKTALLQRIHALGKANDLLFVTAGERASVHALVRSAVRLHDDAAQAHFSLSGPDIEVNARSGLMLALTIHELSTNAAKYGALSRPGGRVALTWALSAEAEPMLSFLWQESGGPVVQAPTRRGFGSRLIEQALAGTVGGTATVDYAADGLVCRIAAPLSGFTYQETSTS